MLRLGVLLNYLVMYGSSMDFNALSLLLNKAFIYGRKTKNNLIHFVIIIIRKQ
jgi:hypothetical protein